MQKLEYIYKPNESDLKDIENKYLKDGWIVKQMVGVEHNLILLLEKETRKEKLDKINQL